MKNFREIELLVQFLYIHFVYSFSYENNFVSVSESNECDFEIYFADKSI